MTTKSATKPAELRHNVADDASKVSKNTGKHPDIVKSDDSVKETPKKRKNLFDGKPGPGRPKGIPNKNTKIVKDMIMAALDQSGGVEYLVAQAKENPKAFLSLLGRIIPVQVTGEGGGPVEHIVTTVKLVPLR